MKRRANSFVILLLSILVVLLAAILGIILFWVLPVIQKPALPERIIPQQGSTLAPATPTPSQTVQPTAIPHPSTATLPPADALEGLRQKGVILLSMRDGAYSHLFAFHPQYLPLTRLTNNPWDDIDPAVSPDGSQVAYASHQNGYWDIYLLELSTGRQSRVTDTPEYDGNPTWSPDGQFLAYESYTGDGMQIFIRSLADPTQAPVQLTFAPGQSFSPAWSPKGREIAFVSTRSGQEDIWLARLDLIDDRFIDVSQNGSGRDHTPHWSPDGNTLAWTRDTTGTSQLLAWNEADPQSAARSIGVGNNAVWSPSSDTLLAEIREPNYTSLAVYQIEDGTIAIPPIRLPGALTGLDWHAGAIADLITSFPVPINARQPAAPLYQPVLTIQTGLQKNRFGIVPLKDVQAPYPYLQDAVDESFQALRKRVADEIGWDFLGSLDNAYYPITTPSLPDLQDNWLYTGRAISVNATPLSAGWISLVREDIGGQTYWRLYLRCLYQDASQGKPLDQRPWDLNARYRGDPRFYDQGGAYSDIPEGYWVDFTSLAAQYGWERLPALINWRTYYPATQFNTFVMRDGLTWQEAMDQVYPSEAVATPTPWVTLTSTITPTPTLWYQWMITPSITPTVTLTATLHPTFTPLAQPAP